MLRIEFKEVRLETVDWDHQAQGKDQWQDPVNMAMNSAFHKRQEISYLAKYLLVSQNGQCSMLTINV